MEGELAKYAALQHFLESVPASTIPMTFSEIEKVIGAPLPASSRRHRAWWSNNPTNNVMTHAWLGAGFESAEVDLDAERLVFRRRAAIKARTPAIKDETPPKSGEVGAPVCIHPLYGALKGMISVEPGYDLTQPLIDPDWVPEPFDE